MPRIRIDVAGQAFEAPLPEAPVRVGSAESCDLRLSCAGVAAEHCVIEPQAGGQHRLRDLQSGRETRVNGVVAHQVSLKPGDVIEVGEARITYADAPAPEPAPAVAVRPSPAARPAPAAAGPAVAAPRSAPRAERPAGGRRLVVPLVVLAIAGAAAIGLSLVLESGSSGGGGEARAQRMLDQALDRLRNRDWLGARDLLDEIAKDDSAGVLRLKAESRLEMVDREIRRAEGALESWRSLALDFDLESAGTKRALFLEEHGEGFAAQVDATIERIREDQRSWVASESARVGAKAAEAVAEGKFADARRTWEQLRASAPSAVDVGPAVEKGLAAVDEAAAAATVVLFARAEREAGLGGPGAAVALLGAALTRYGGTGSYGAVASRLADWERKAREAPKPVEVAPSSPSATSETPASAAAERATATALAEADAAAAARLFAKAVDRLDAAMPSLPKGPARERLEARRNDLALARNGLDLLAGDVKENGRKYMSVEMAPRFFVALVDADRETVSGAIPGGRTKYRWAQIDVALFQSLVVDRMKPATQDLLAASSLLHEVGAEDAARKLLFLAGSSGIEPRSLFPMLARWRKEAVPEGGYVPYEGRYVTTSEREALVLEARIQNALARVRGKDVAARKAAYAELEKIGAPAAPRYREALQSRRLAAISELADLKVFTSAKTRAKLFDLLEKARAEALALIEDAAAYPYPNPTHRNQPEVEALVDKVRQVWERPFEIVCQWDDKVREALASVVEVDEALAKAVMGYRPDLDAVMERVNKAVDMPSYVPTSQAANVREYSLKVLAFNERIPTTATREEKDNVRAVNEYRMMMGRHALKINELLVRSARGHSRHMRVNGYFDHTAPDPALASPGLRAARQGYGGGVGENIARGTWSGRDAFRAWFGSSGHHRNMLARGWTEMGAGRSGGDWWTQNFGAMGGKGLSDPNPAPEPAADVAPEPEDERGRPVQPGKGEVPDKAPPGSPPPDKEPDSEDPPAPGGD
jgi:uncharacterized protein YkwD